MNTLTRRDALRGATAAVAVTGAITAPLAFKAAGVQAALGGDPVLPAYETFEAARLKYVAMYDHACAVTKEIEAALGPEPYRTWASDEPRHKIATSRLVAGAAPPPRGGPTGHG